MLFRILRTREMDESSSGLRKSYACHELRALTVKTFLPSSFLYLFIRVPLDQQPKSPARAKHFVLFERFLISPRAPVSVTAVKVAAVVKLRPDVALPTSNRVQ